MTRVVRSLSNKQTSSGTWVAGGLTVNPLANDVIVDTGALSVGDYLFEFFIDSTVATRLIIEHRNAANGATLKSKEIPVAADSLVQIVLGNEFSLVDNERVRAIMKSSITGTVQGSIIYAKYN
jgi:hypothetical protein